VNTTNQNDKVVGVFFDEGYAQQAIQALQAAGYQARIADESAIKSFRKLGWEDEVAALYESRYNEGNAIVVVEGGDGTNALNMLLEYGAEYLNLHAQGQGKQSAGTQTEAYDAAYYQNLQAEQRQYGRYDEQLGRARKAEELRVQLRDETLTPVKEAQQSGEVQVRKVVHERQVEVPVTLRQEEVIIERVPVDREISAAEAGEITDMGDQVIRVPVYEEQVELQKSTRVREEVTIGKRAVEQQQNVSGTTRHEHLEVEETGEVRVQGNAQETTVRNANAGMTQNQDTANTDNA
jgi:uncharacterized protein (TIGR02271 family)